MKKCIDKAAIENILHKLWKKDTGYENIDIARIAYNRALQDVQKAIDSKQEEPVSEDKMTISKEWFEHCKKSWYNEGYIDGEYNRDRQLAKNKSITLDDLGEFISELSKQFPEVSFAKVCKIATRTAKWQKEQLMAKAIEGIEEINNNHHIMRYSDCCEPPLSELIEWFKNYIKEEKENEVQERKIK